MNLCTPPLDGTSDAGGVLQKMMIVTAQNVVDFQTGCSLEAVPDQNDGNFFQKRIEWCIRNLVTVYLKGIDHEKFEMFEIDCIFMPGGGVCRYGLCRNPDSH